MKTDIKIVTKTSVWLATNTLIIFQYILVCYFTSRYMLYNIYMY